MIESVRFSGRLKQPSTGEDCYLIMVILVLQD